MRQKIVLWLLITAGALPAALAQGNIVPAPPSVDAVSYLVMDYESGRMLVRHNIDEKVEPASLTKMMTVYVVGDELAAGHIKMDDEVTVSEKAWRMQGSKMFIEVGKQVSVEDLLKGVIIQSGNDASVALAEYVAGSEDVFAAMMNQEAKRLGMTSTHFMNSTGWPHEDHYTTAHDLAILGRALIHDHPEIYGLHSVKEFTYNGIKQHNRNDLLWRDPGVDGIKTGHTESAGYCLVVSAKRDDMRLISVVMGTDGPKSRVRASEALLNFAFRFFETHKLVAAGQPVTSPRIWKGMVKTLPLGLQEDLYVTIPRGALPEVKSEAELPPVITAPVSSGSMLGNLKVSLQGETLATRPLVALAPVAEGSLFSRLMDDIFLLFE